MRIVIDVRHHFEDGGEALDQELRILEDRIMSALSDKIAEVQASLDAAIARIDAQAVTPADLDAIDALKALKMGFGEIEAAFRSQTVELEGVKRDVRDLKERHTLPPAPPPPPPALPFGPA